VGVPQEEPQNLRFGTCTTGESCDRETTTPSWRLRKSEEASDEVWQRKKPGDQREPYKVQLPLLLNREAGFALRLYFALKAKVPTPLPVAFLPTKAQNGSGFRERAGGFRTPNTRRHR